MTKTIIIVLVVAIVGIVAFAAVDKFTGIILDDTATTSVLDDDYLTCTISGEVLRPGTYLLEADANLGDLVIKASGTTSNADPLAYDLEYELLDDMVFYIAPIYDNGDTCAITPIAKTNINKDTKAEMMAIDGIGDAIATNIIRYREDTALFKRIEDIKNVTGIGEATFTRIKDRITIKETA